jgi:hypothetical protein
MGCCLHEPSLAGALGARMDAGLLIGDAAGVEAGDVDADDDDDEVGLNGPSPSRSFRLPMETVRSDCAAPIREM